MNTCFIMIMIPIIVIGFIVKLISGNGLSNDRNHHENLEPECDDQLFDEYDYYNDHEDYVDEDFLNGD